MGAELKAVLTLDSRNYDKNIQSAVNSTKKYQKQVDETQKELDELKKSGGTSQELFQKFGKSMGMSNESMLKYGKHLGAITKGLGVAGVAVGVAVGAFKAYDAIMNSNGNTAGEWNDKMNGLTTTVNNFFSALASGDWHVFANGLSNAIELAVRAHKALRELQLDLYAGDGEMKIYMKDMNKYEAIINDPKTKKEEKEAAYKKYYDIYENKFLKRQNQIKGSAEKNLPDVLAGYGINLNNMNASDLQAWMYQAISPSSDMGQAMKKWTALEEQNKAASQQLVDATTGIYFNYEQRDKDKAAAEKNLTIIKKQQTDLLKQFPTVVQAIRFNGVAGGSIENENFKTFVDLNEKQIGIEDQGATVAAQKRGIDELFDAEGNLIPLKGAGDFGGSGGSGGSGKVKTEKPLTDAELEILKNAEKYVKLVESVLNLNDVKAEFSEADLKQINGIKETLKKSIKENKFADAAVSEMALKEKINPIMNTDIEIPVIPLIKLDRDKSLKELEHDRDVLAAQLEKSQTPDEYIKIKARIDAKDAQIQNFQEGRDATLPDMSAEIRKATEYNMTFNDTLAELQEKAEKSWKAMQEGAARYADAISNVANVFGQLGSAIGGTTGEWLSFTGVVLQGIADILPQIAKLVGGKFAEAMSAGTASAAAMPFPANLAAIASITATIIGIFAALPSFAEGGIFDGKTSMGDYNIARVNSGEMILNNSQQGRLFRLLNEGGAMGNRGYNTEREWVIRGSDLVGVVKNYNKIQSKLGKNIMK